MNQKNITHQKVVYLSGLNGIRAIAAVGVMVSHIGLALNHFYGHSKGFSMTLAGEGVTMFFTLSGFLITYLLLIEEKETGSISLKKFYVRRILRIWPLYFTIILLACLYYGVFGNGVENIKYIWLYVFFLSNIAFNLNLYPQSLGPLWSIGIEEQFYLLWPIIFKKRGVNIIRNLIMFILIWEVLKLIIKVYSLSTHNKIPFSIISTMGFDSMAIGVLVAFLFYKKNNLLLKITNNPLIPVVFFLMVVLLIFSLYGFLSIYGRVMTSIVTSLFIVNQINNPHKIFSLEKPIFNFLGRISFGIYVYHTFILDLFSDYTKAYFPNLIINTYLIYAITIVITIVISYISYQFFERRFLLLKGRFSQIKSRN